MHARHATPNIDARMKNLTKSVTRIFTAAFINGWWGNTVDFVKTNISVCICNLLLQFTINWVKNYQ